MPTPVQTSTFRRGVNNTADETALPRDVNGNLIAVREGVNVDVSEAGKLSRRAGYTRIASGSHSGWSDDYLPYGFYADGDALRVLHEDESSDVLITGLAPGLPISYARVNDLVLWSNEVQCGQINRDLEVGDWSTPSPNGQPTLSSTDGALDPGTYQVAVTFLGADGRESGASRAAMLMLPVGGGIQLDDIPQPPAGGRVRVYCTGGNDGVLRAAVTLAEGITSLVLAQRPEGRPCDTQFLRPMPAGQCVAVGNGRQYVARGNEVLFSPALRYGLWDAKAGRVGFAGRITMITFVGDGTPDGGLYVADSKRTYFLAGANPMEWSQRIAYHAGAIPGQIAWTPGELWGAPMLRCPTWLARNGRVVVGMPGGQPLLPQPGEGGPDAVWDVGQSAALGYFERPGDRRIISAVSGATPGALAMQDRLVVREYRHDT